MSNFLQMLTICQAKNKVVYRDNNREVLADKNLNSIVVSFWKQKGYRKVIHHML